MVAVVVSRNEVLADAVALQLGAGATVVSGATEVPDAVDVLVAVADRHGDGAAFVAEVTAAMERVVPSMVSRGSGRIVIVVHAAGLPGSSWRDGTGTAMWGLVGLARTAARELAASGVTVNVVRAGLLDLGGESPPDDLIADTPLRRAGTAADVAAAVRYLASPEAAYVTGLVLPVDGGLTMGQGA